MDNSWDEAKKLFWMIPFPNEVGREEYGSYSHEVGLKTIHGEKKYVLFLAPILEFKIEGHYAYCPECQKIRQKYLVMFNTQKGVVALNRIVRNGKPWDGDDTLSVFL